MPKTALAASGFSYVEGSWKCCWWTLSGTYCATATTTTTTTTATGTIATTTAAAATTITSTTTITTTTTIVTTTTATTTTTSTAISTAATQHVSGDTPPIIWSLKLHWKPLVFFYVESCWTCSW